MKLYLFNKSETASIYGIGTYLEELTNALANADINVHIVHLHSIRPEFEIEKIGKIENWYIPEVANNNTFYAPFSKMEDYLQNVIYFLRLHIESTKDLIFHFNINVCQLLAKELKAAFNCKTVATVHYLKWMLELHGNLTKFHTLKSKSDNQRNTFEKIQYKNNEYESRLFKEVDHIIALSQYTSSFISSEYQINPKKISVILNGMKDKNSGLGTDKHVLRKKWRIPEKEFLFLFTGRVYEGKGIQFLIRAFRKILETVPDCRLLIAGNGEFDVYMKECADICTHITWTGLLSKEKLYELYSIADVGVLPSLSEQCSYVAIEMMMYGLPLIVSDVSGLSEMIDDGVTGLKFPVHENEKNVEIDVSMLTQKMMYMLKNETERERMGSNARKKYKKFYSSEIMGSKMFCLYKSLFY